ELAELVDVENFIRVGKHGEEMRWDDAVALMHRHIAMPHDYTLRAVTEAGDRVFLELEEFLEHDGQKMAFNSVYIYTFDRTGKIGGRSSTIISRIPSRPGSCSPAPR